MIMPLIPTQTDRQPPRPGRIPATASPAASSSPNNKKRKRERESQSQGGVKKRVVVIDPKEKSESARINTDDVKIKTKGIEGNALQKGKKQEKVQEKKLPSGPADYVPIETERSESQSCSSSASPSITLTQNYHSPSKTPHSQPSSSTPSNTFSSLSSLYHCISRSRIITISD